MSKNKSNPRSTKSPKFSISTTMDVPAEDMSGESSVKSESDDCLSELGKMDQLNINDKSKFDGIVIEEDILSTVGSFKAIVAPGKKRPLLDKKAHDELVEIKYVVASGMKEHITLFRVQDKKALPPMEIKEHTVPGPQWTPPSSVGFVMGALSKGHRVWLSTEPSSDGDGFASKEGDPAIYARETMTAIILGWLARDSKKSETYGKTDRGPTRVLTPPSSPKGFDIADMKSIMDVKSGWNDLPMTMDQLLERTTPISQRVQQYLDDDTANSINPLLLKLAENKNIFPLIEDGTLCFLEMTDVGVEALRKMLTNKGILKRLKNGDLTFKKLIEAYNFVEEHADEDIELSEIVNYAIYNQDLYHCFLTDEYSLINTLGVNEFIRDFKDAQARIEQMSDDDPSKIDSDPYELVNAEVEKDGAYDYLDESEDEVEGYDHGNTEELLYPEDSIEDSQTKISEDSTNSHLLANVTLKSLLTSYLKLYPDNSKLGGLPSYQDNDDE